MDKELAKKFRKEYLIAGLVSFFSAAILFVIIFLLAKAPLSDAFAIPGVLLLTVGSFMFMTKEGFFDFASYGFRQLGSIIFSKKANANRDYPQYRVDKKEDRKKHSNYFIVVLLNSVLFFIGVIIVSILVK